MQEALLTFAEGLLCMAVTGTPLVLVLVVLNRRRARHLSIEHGVSEQGGWSFWKGVMISSVLGALFCGAGAALAYSPSSITGSSDSIGAGIVMFCGIAAFLIGIVASWQRSRR
jgi:hypothetical protein